LDAELLDERPPLELAPPTAEDPAAPEGLLEEELEPPLLEVLVAPPGGGLVLVFVLPEAPALPDFPPEEVVPPVPDFPPVLVLPLVLPLLPEAPPVAGVPDSP
jgi:hypothetical protein